MPTPINEPLRVTVARIEEKVDTLITQRVDGESRLRKVEAWMYGLPLGLVVSIASLVIAWRK